MLIEVSKMARDDRCHTCDGTIKFVPYTHDQLPGKQWCCAHCVYRYLQAKQQHDQALQLQPLAIGESDECDCALCTDDG